MPERCRFPGVRNMFAGLEYHLRGGGQGSGKRLKTKSFIAGPGAMRKKNRQSKDTVKTMAPPIDWAELEEPCAEKRTGKLLKERRKWKNPHIKGKRVSLRQARVLRASNEVMSACRASVSFSLAPTNDNFEVPVQWSDKACFVF
jgi:hypothetical protein